MAGAKLEPESVVYGVEWVVEAHGCNPGALTDLRKLDGFFRTVIRELTLHPLQKTVWHQFPRTGGITGLCLLSESHLACHTFPEYGSLCLNVFCCRPRPDAGFEAWLRDEFEATRVQIRRIERSYRP